jgi:hypothetical protein
MAILVGTTIVGVRKVWMISIEPNANMAAIAKNIKYLSIKLFLVIFFYDFYINVYSS